MQNLEARKFFGLDENETYDLEQLEKRYVLDSKLSKKIFKEDKRSYKLKQCYNNVFNMVSNHYRKFQNNEWTICYGYHLVHSDTLWARHCFVKDNTTGLIIDPTSIQLSDERTYIIVKELDLYTYYELLEKDKKLPALEKTLSKEFRESQVYGIDKGYLFIG